MTARAFVRAARRRAIAVRVIVATAAAAAMTAIFPVTAWACPNCAREAAGTPAWLLLGAMIAVPYAIAAVAFKVVRRLQRSEDRP